MDQQQKELSESPLQKQLYKLIICQLKHDGYDEAAENLFSVTELGYCPPSNRLFEIFFRGLEEIKRESRKQNEMALNSMINGRQVNHETFDDPNFKDGKRKQIESIFEEISPKKEKLKENGNTSSESNSPFFNPFLPNSNIDFFESFQKREVNLSLSSGSDENSRKTPSIEDDQDTEQTLTQETDKIFAKKSLSPILDGSFCDSFDNTLAKSEPYNHPSDYKIHNIASLGDINDNIPDDEIFKQLKIERDMKTNVLKVTVPAVLDRFLSVANNDGKRTISEEEAISKWNRATYDYLSAILEGGLQFLIKKHEVPRFISNDESSWIYSGDIKGALDPRIYIPRLARAFEDSLLKITCSSYERESKTTTPKESTISPYNKCDLPPKYKDSEFTYVCGKEVSRSCIMVGGINLTYGDMISLLPGREATDLVLAALLSVLCKELRQQFLICSNFIPLSVTQVLFSEIIDDSIISTLQEEFVGNNLIVIPLHIYLTPKCGHYILLVADVVGSKFIYYDPIKCALSNVNTRQILDSYTASARSQIIQKFEVLRSVFEKVTRSEWYQQKDNWFYRISSFYSKNLNPQQDGNSCGPLVVEAAEKILKFENKLEKLDFEINKTDETGEMSHNDLRLCQFQKLLNHKNQDPS